MKTTKMVAAFVLVVALILGGCSPNGANSEGKTTTPLARSTTLGTTTAGGNLSTTPNAMGTADNTTTTPELMTTQGTSTSPLLTTEMPGTPGAKGTMTTLGTPTVLATTNAAVSPTLMATMATTKTTAAMATLNPTTTVAVMGTPTLASTAVVVGTPAPTTMADAVGTPAPTTTVDTMGTPTPTTTAALPGASGSTGDLVAQQSIFEQIYKQVNPSVVYIEVVIGSGSTNGSASGSNRGSGSGFVWDAEGHIITNNHVVSDATSINVTFMDGTTAKAELIGQDPNADLAVLLVKVPSAALHPVTMGDSTKVRVGQIAIAIGNPFGLAGSMSTGIVSALSRSLPVESNQKNGNNPTNGVYNIPNIIQTDAAINPGNSGGVLVNLQGEVIGVTAAIASQSQSNSGIGFVIPAEIVTKVVPDLISTGKYAHSWLGITGLTMSTDVASKINLPATQRGTLIIAVTPGGPAAAAGLLPSKVDNSTGNITTTGDIITAINGQPVRVFEDLGSYLFMQSKPGDVITLTVMRDGKEQTIKVTLGTLPTP